jgi:WD40-like Beta Propeller Repeat
MKRIFYFLIIALIFTSCSGNRLNYDKGIIPPVPVNFSSVNSSYDDYNSNLQISWTERYFSLIFSTNRNSNGNNFDFISYNGHIMFDLLDGEFEMQANSREYGLLEAVNNSSNQLGPYITTDFPYDAYWMKEGEDRRFFYSSDADGSLDIFCCRYEFGEEVFNPDGDPFPVTPLNTEYDEGYLSVHIDAAMNRETVYFMSDRDGSFDIYHATGEEGKLISESAAVTVTRSSVLSSSADDKCPYIYGGVIVFASDREGGFGGFDLWYSVFNGQQWEAPVNMGGEINTEYDEYRPVVVQTEDSYVNDLMVFSSNRPGGKGGFDLYYVGIPRREYDPGLFPF